MSINKVILIGSVGNDPEIRATNDGREIASFSVATTDKWTDKNSNEKKEKTEWHKVSVFGGLVNVVKNYVKKGTKVYIEGSLETQKYEKDGQDHYATKVILKQFNSTLQILSPKKEESGEVSKHSQDKGNGFVSESVESDDEIPF